jgi:hypothetical protein
LGDIAAAETGKLVAWWHLDNPDATSVPAGRRQSAESLPDNHQANIRHARRVAPLDSRDTVRRQVPKLAC